MEAPKLWTTFKNIRREPNRFRYQPKHYDAKKDEFEMRMKRVEQRVNGMRGEENDGDERASFDFKNSRRKTIDRSSSNYRSGLAAANRRLLVILGVLILAFVTAAKWLENMEG